MPSEVNHLWRFEGFELNPRSQEVLFAERKKPVAFDDHSFRLAGVRSPTVHGDSRLSFDETRVLTSNPAKPGFHGAQ
jgi:hypothetical protein